MAAEDRSGGPRTSITRPEVPVARPPTSTSGARRIDGTSFRPPPEDLDLRPTSVEQAWLDVLLEDLCAVTSRSECERWRRALTEGAYASVVEELEEACRAAPRNRSLANLATELRGVVRGLLHARLGPGTRRLLACEREGVLGPGMQRVFELCREPTTVAQVVRAIGGDDIPTRERILRLLERGWLLAGPLPAAPAKIDRPGG